MKCFYKMSPFNAYYQVIVGSTQTIASSQQSCVLSDYTLHLHKWVVWWFFIWSCDYPNNFYIEPCPNPLTWRIHFQVVGLSPINPHATAEDQKHRFEGKHSNCLLTRDILSLYASRGSGWKVFWVNPNRITKLALDGGCALSRGVHFPKSLIQWLSLF